jgi:hypothetical protein
MAGAFQLNATMPSLGDALGQQVATETDDERKRRMALLQQQQMLGPAGSLSVSSLLAPSVGKAGGSGY